MAEGRQVGEVFQARCEVCGAWQPVRPQPRRADAYFEYWEAAFSCCGRKQAAWFTVEKVDDDIH